MIDPVERVLVSFLHDQPARLGEVLAIEAVAQSLLMLEICVVLASLGATLSVREPLIIEGGGKLTVIAFFFIPGQVGAAEAVSASLLRAVGLPASAGLTLAFVRRIRSLLCRERRPAGVRSGATRPTRVTWADRGLSTKRRSKYGARSG